MPLMLINQSLNMSQELLHTILEQHAVQHADKIAITEENAAISYKQLKAGVDKLAEACQLAGLQPGNRAAVLMPPGIKWVTTMLALFKTGLIYLPLSSAYPDKKLQDIYKQTRFSCLVVTKDFLPRAQALLNALKDHGIILLVLEDDGSIQQLQPADMQPEPPVAERYKDSNYIIYTSGSTGAGKAIVGSIKGLAHFISWQVREFGLDERCQVSQLTSMVFDASFRDVLLPLSVGGTLHIPGEATRNNTALLVQWLIKNQVSLIHCVPAMWKLITRQLEQQPVDKVLLQNLQYIFLAGEPLYARDVMKWRAAAGEHTQIINLYGTSETTMAKTFYRVSALPANPAQVLPVGKPIDNTAIAIINHNHLCRAGELGEVYIKTPYWTKGYYNDDVLTSMVFVQNPLVSGREDLVYRTGDLGRYLEDQTIEVIGRVDDQVKINGVRVELGEVEQAVLQMPGIQEAVIKTRQDEEGRYELVCYYTNNQITAEDLRAFLRTVLTETMIPAYFVYLQEFPLTPSGKVDKKALPDPDLHTGAMGYESPQSNTELQMEQIWKEVLKKQQVGRNESFFTTGGNSLKAIQLITRISREFKVQVKVVEIFNNQTIARLSALVERLGKTEQEPIPVCAPQEYYDVSHAQKRLWALYQMDPGSYAYNIPQAFELEGDLNTLALEKALEAIIGRHEILRTNFVLAAGKPVQQIHPAGAVQFPLEYVDLRNEAEQAIVLNRLLLTAAAAPFNLSTDRLLRTVLYRLSANRYVFFLNMHHIITDQWSEEVFFSELLQAYHSLEQGMDVTLPALRIQYKDFAAWHNRQLDTTARQEHQAYWHAQLNGRLTEVSLPLDFPRPELRTAAGGSVELEIDTTASKQLLTLALQHRTGPFVLLLAAIKALAYRFTGQRQVIIGTPWACRNHPDLETQIGFYVNTLPVAVQADPQETFITLLQQVRDIAATVGQHQDYPFDMILEDLQITRKPNRAPVFDIGFTWHDRINMAPSANALNVTPYPLDFSGIKSDLWFHGSAAQDILQLSLEYSGDLFRESTARMLLTSLEKILLKVLQNPDASLEQLTADVAAPVLDKDIAGIEFSF